jgi:hypothetical protein
MRPFFRHDERAVDEAFGEIDLIAPIPPEGILPDDCLNERNYEHQTAS